MPLLGMGSSPGAATLEAAPPWGTWGPALLLGGLRVRTVGGQPGLMPMGRNNSPAMVLPWLRGTATVIMATGPFCGVHGAREAGEPHFLLLVLPSCCSAWCWCWGGVWPWPPLLFPSLPLNLSADIECSARGLCLWLGRARGLPLPLRGGAAHRAGRDCVSQAPVLCRRSQCGRAVLSRVAGGHSVLSVSPSSTTKGYLARAPSPWVASLVGSAMGRTRAPLGSGHSDCDLMAGAGGSPWHRALLPTSHCGAVSPWPMAASPQQG